MFGSAKRNEPQIEAPRRRELHPEVAGIFDNIARTRDERDQLFEQNEALQERLAAARREIVFLKEKLHDVEFSRDFYQRHYIALFTRLNDMGILIDNAIAEAKREADAAALTPDSCGARAEGTAAVEEAIKPPTADLRVVESKTEGFQSQHDQEG